MIALPEASVQEHIQVAKNRVAVARRYVLGLTDTAVGFAVLSAHAVNNGRTDLGVFCGLVGIGAALGGVDFLRHYIGERRALRRLQST